MWPRENGTISEKNKGGGKLRRGETYHKTPPQKWFWTPPTYDTFCPPVCSLHVILFGGNGHRPDKSHFLRPPKVVLEGVLYSTFSPPKIARYVLPPHWPLANHLSFGRFVPLFYSNFLLYLRPIPVMRPVVVSLRFPLS